MGKKPPFVDDTPWFHDSEPLPAKKGEPPRDGEKKAADEPDDNAEEKKALKEKAALLGEARERDLRQEEILSIKQIQQTRTPDADWAEIVEQDRLETDPKKDKGRS